MLHGSPLVVTVVLPALAQAERAFAATLGAINLDDLVKRAEKAKLRLRRSDARAPRLHVHGLDS